MRNLRLLLAPVLACVLLGNSFAPAVVSAAILPLQSAPTLGLASSFAVLGGTTVTNTGLTVVNADLGVSPGTAVTGFPGGKLVGGLLHAADLLAGLAQADVTTAYNNLAGQVCPFGNDLTGQDLGGKTLAPGVYCFSSSAQLTGVLTLDAHNDANAVFIFKVGSTLTTASAASVLLINGGLPNNVFWQVGSSATLGTTTAFIGNILALTSITVTTGTTVVGRVFARNGAVTLDTNSVGLVGLTTLTNPLPPVPPTLNSLLKIHPLLQNEALTNPSGVVRVIVQQNGPLAGGAAEHFTVIPAVVTTVQLGSLAALALDPNVRYISQDGAVEIIPSLMPLVDAASTSQPAVTGTFAGANSRSTPDSTRLTTTYPMATGATNAWAGSADFGVSPGTAITGFPTGKVPGGNLHAGDTLAAQAQADVTTAWNNLTGQACPGGNDLTGQDLGGKTLTPGVYCFSSSAQLTGGLTLNAQGNPNAVFVFKMGSTLTTASAASVVMTNGASPCNVFWQVGSSATLGTNTRFAGNLIALASITLTTGTVVSGRAFARTAAVTMDSNTVGVADCEVGANSMASAQPSLNAVAPSLGSAASFVVLGASTVTSTGPTAVTGGPSDTGAGVTVAVLDSGVDFSHPDLSGHVMAVNVNLNASGPMDGFGHGTHVAGVIAGQDSAGQYVGVAPGANVVSVKVSDDAGVTHESDVLRGLQWVSQHQATYNIRALNMSLSGSVPQSYATSPMDAAVENVWHQGVTVVASAGNLGADKEATWYAPGNDPLVITVGCFDDNLTAASGDDSLCPISSHGMTEDGFAKPDLLAPGRKVVSTLASGINGQPVVLAKTYADRISADGRHIRLSGTSMSAPIVTGAVALLLARHPGLTPDQIKKLLVASAVNYPGQADNAGELNIVAALQSASPAGTPQTPLSDGATAPPAGASTLLFDGNHYANAYWVNGHWDNGHWDNGHWDAAYWDNGHWDAAYWDNGHWDASTLDNGHWDNGHWDNGHWDNGHWDNGHWDNGHWDSSTYD